MVAQEETPQQQQHHQHHHHTNTASDSTGTFGKLKQTLSSSLLTAQDKGM